MTKVVVVDYGLGNLHSVVKALRHENADAQVSNDPDVVRTAERLVLPGVGAFSDGMAGLRRANLVDAVREFARTGRPFLGICLGMQLLFDESEEFGRHEGLGLVAGNVVVIPRVPGRKVPHIGWTKLQPAGDWTGTPLEPIAPGTAMYFVHSYTAAPAREEDRLADADYGGFRISAAIRKDNVVGMQFHPEKSGSAGLIVLARYLR